LFSSIFSSDEEPKLNIYEKKCCRKYSDPRKKTEVSQRKLHNEELQNLFSSTTVR
jgi:hypothetical protein